MASELAYEASDEASESELLERSLSVWRGWSAHDVEDFGPIPLDLHTACSIGHFEYVRNLINRSDIEVDCKNRGGWTSLMYACYIGHEHIASLLIDAGCNVNIKNSKGQTPLMLAASCGNENVGRTLCRNGAELEAWDRQGWTALFHATYAGHQNFVCFLLEQGANLNAVEPASGMTPFLQAAAEGHEIIVQLLLQGGVDVNARSVHGDTARTLALVNGHIKIVSLIDHHTMPQSSALRSEPGLEGYLSSSDEAACPPPRPHHHGRGLRVRSRGPSIRDGPDAIARLIDRTHHGQEAPPRPPRGAAAVVGAGVVGGVPQGYLSFPPQGEGEAEEQPRLSYRDVTSPINLQDYALDSSGGKDSCDYDYEGNAFSQTGAITIKSSSSSSGGLAAALGLSHTNSLDSDDPTTPDPRPRIQPESADPPLGGDQPPTHLPQGQATTSGLRTVSPQEKVSDFLSNLKLEGGVVGSQEGRPLSAPCTSSVGVTSPAEVEGVARRETGVVGGVPPGSSGVGVGATGGVGGTGGVVGVGGSLGEGRKEGRGPLQSSSAPPPGTRRQQRDAPPPPGSSSGVAAAVVQGEGGASLVPAVAPAAVPGLQTPRIPGVGGVGLGAPPAQTSEFGQALLQNPSLHLQHTPTPSQQQPPHPPFPPPPDTWSAAPQPPRGQGPPGVRSRDPFSSRALPEAACPPLLPQPSNGMPGTDPFHPPHPQEGSAGGEGAGGDVARDLGMLLRQLGLAKYLPVLEEQDVDLQVFLSLTDHDLKEIGIKPFGPRKKMTNAIARWHSGAPLHCSGFERAYADRLEGEMQELAVQLNQAVLEVERLWGQVQQEQQLRGVAEGCLMEERALWQGARQGLQELRRAVSRAQEAACHLKRLHSELREAISQAAVSGPVAMETGEAVLTTADRRLGELLQATSSASATADLLLTTLHQAPPPDLPTPDPYS